MPGLKLTLGIFLIILGTAMATYFTVDTIDRKKFVGVKVVYIEKQCQVENSAEARNFLCVKDPKMSTCYTFIRLTSGKIMLLEIPYSFADSATVLNLVVKDRPVKK